MSGGPRRLMLEVLLDRADMAAATQAAIAACKASPAMPAVRGWREGEEGEPEPDALPGPAAAVVSLVFATEAHDGLILPGDEPGRFTLALTWRGEAGAEDALGAWRAVLAALAHQGGLRHGAVWRHLGGNCLPVLPLVGDSTHLMACPPEDVARAYDDAGAFAAAWDRVDRVGGTAIFERALDAVGNPDFLRRVLPGQMAMARLARGGVGFRAPAFEPGEFDLLNAGEPTLAGVGYHAGSAVYEFSGHVPRGTELRCIDWLNAARLASERRLPDGRPVREVRAVFMDRDQAERAGGLLRAAGVAVYWEDETATLRAL